MPLCRVEEFIKDELCDYVLLFGGDIKRETNLWPEDDNFKTLLYERDELQGTMLDFYLQFMLQLEKPGTWKRYYIIHNWTTPILNFMCIEEGNAREKITQQGVRNLRSTNGVG